MRTGGAGRTVGRTPVVTMPQAFGEEPATDPFEREAAVAAAEVAAGQPVRRVTSLSDGRPVQRAAVGEEEAEPPQTGGDGPVQRVAVGEEELQRTPLGGAALVQRVAVGEEEVQRAPVEDPATEGSVLSSLRSLESAGAASRSSVASMLGSPGAGAPLPASVRSAIEPRLGISLEPIEIHRGADAAAAAADVGARAFTYGRHIYLGEGESPYDLGLMAHEAVHAVQQGAISGLFERFAPPDHELQRLPRSIRRGLARYARHIPGYTLFTVVIGVEPLTGDRVERNARNLVGGLLGLIPFGTVIFDKLVELGVIDDALAFIESQLARFDLSLSRLQRMLSESWDEMEFVRLDPISYNIGVLQRKFGQLLSDVRGFVRSMVDAVIELIRDAVVSVADALLADEPAWSLIKKVLGHDPLRDEPVEADTAEILADFLLLIGRETELEQMRERGTLQETADWLDTQVETFHGLLGELGELFSAAWEAIQPQNLPQLSENLRSLASRVVGLLGRAFDFAWEVAAKVLELVKDALLNMLSDFAHEAPGFPLLTVVLGRNPFTGEEVPRNAENLIRGFITLLPGGGEAYERLSEAGIIGQAAATIEGALSDLGISWAAITDLFLGIWDSLSIDDLVAPVQAFQRIRDAFGEPISRLFEFIRVVLNEVIKLILELMNFPSQVLGSIIDNAVAAYEDIKNDPIGFIINLLVTVKEGFTRFFGGIVEHLLNGMRDWLFRSLRQAGIEPPSEWTLETGLELVMQVLGVTVDRLWEKLAERIGQERVDQIRGAMDRLEGIWTFVRDVQERGPAALWEHIRDRIGGLWNTILEQARDWVMETIVRRVTARLLSMLDPSGVMAVVNSFVAFFNAIQSAIEYLRELLDIVDQWVATLAAVARGDVEPGAARLELGLISAVPVAIGFLANQVGLGNVGDRLQEIIGGLREMVDRALDWLLDQAERLLQEVMSALGFGAEAEEVGDTGDPEHDAAVTEGLAAISVEEQARATNGRISREDAEAVAAAVSRAHPVFSSLTVVDGGARWLYAWTASNGTQHDTPDTEKAEGESPYLEQPVAHPEVQDALREADYVPYQRGSTWIIRRKDRTSSLPILSVDAEGNVCLGPLSHEKTAIDQPDWVPETRITENETLRTITVEDEAKALKRAEVGTRVVASPLTSIGSGGSEVRNANALWDVLRLRPEGKRSYWVQGHLLNADLHGPGNQPWNLTPISQAANKQHYTDVERHVKKAVLKAGEHRDSDEVPVVHYEITADYAGRTLNVPVTATPDVRRTLEAEQYLATSLKLEAYHLHEDQPGDWTKRGRSIASETIDLAFPVPPPDFVVRV
jgi:hypothetical protein